jgi:hypothetical protein
VAILSLIGETLGDFEHELNAAATRALSAALGQVAPKGCSLRVIVSKRTASKKTDSRNHSDQGTNLMHFDNPRIAVETLSMPARALPIMWQNGAAARPLDGAMMHATTPLAPLRSRLGDDGTQTTVTIPHMLPWTAPHRYTNAQARTLKSFTRRAVKHADVVVTPNYATAELLIEHFGTGLNVQVHSQAPLPEYVAGDDRDERASQLGLPEEYVVTTADLSDTGRLHWLADLVQDHPEFPKLVVIGKLGKTDALHDGTSSAENRDDSKGAADLSEAPDPEPADELVDPLATTTFQGATSEQIVTADDYVSDDGTLEIDETAEASSEDASSHETSTDETSSHEASTAEASTDEANTSEDENSEKEAGSEEAGANDAAADEAGASESAAAKTSQSVNPSKPARTKTQQSAQSTADAVDQLAARSNGRVQVIHPRELADVGAIIAGAKLMVLPQKVIGVGYEAYGAIANGVPVLHADLQEIEEITLDAGRTFDSPETLETQLTDILSDETVLNRLSVLADDRANFFSWDSTAWAIWELHANL